MIIYDFCVAIDMYPECVKAINATDRREKFNVAVENEVRKRDAKALQDAVKSRLSAATKHPGYTRLRPSERAAIFHCVDKIILWINASGLIESRKKHILHILANLRAEVDKPATSTQVAVGCVTEAAMYAGEISEANVGDYRAALRDTANLLFHAKARDEGLTLLPGENRPLLMEGANDGQ